MEGGRRGEERGGVPLYPPCCLYLSEANVSHLGQRLRIHSNKSKSFRILCFSLFSCAIRIRAQEEETGPTGLPADPTDLMGSGVRNSVQAKKPATPEGLCSSPIPLCPGPAAKDSAGADSQRTRADVCHGHQALTLDLLWVQPHIPELLWRDSERLRSVHH